MFFGWWWLRSRYCCSLLCGLGQVQKAVANSHFKAHLFQDTRQGVHSLRSVNYDDTVMVRRKNEYLKASVRTGNDINLFLLEALVCRDETER